MLGRCTDNVARASEPVPEGGAVSLPYPCEYGFPGGAYPYCELNDSSIILNTWVRGDSVVDFRLCAREQRYNVTVQVEYVWTRLLAREVTLPLTTSMELVQFSAEQPCLRRFIRPIWPDAPEGDDTGKWSPDVRSIALDYRVWIALVAQEPGE